MSRLFFVSMVQFKRASLAVLVSGALAACGGGADGGNSGGGVGSSPAPSLAPTPKPTDAPVVSTGVVLGSYFRNAKVCFDENNNGQCDNNEVSTRTDSNGQFKLSGSRAPLVAEIGLDAKRYDPDTKTETALTQALILRAPKEWPTTISLHTTSVVSEMENQGLSFDDAVKKVANALAVPANKLLADFNLETDAGNKAALKAASDDGIRRIQAAIAGKSADSDLKKLLAESTQTDRYYQTKTPYRPQQDRSSYEAAPAGFNVVNTQLIARHGSRGLSSLKYDLAVYNMWSKAKEEGALTPLGEKLGADVLKIMKANFLLGHNVAGISKPGYGNETQVGIEEHQQLAVRMLQRQPDFWQQVAKTASSSPRKIIFVTSGVDRAVDSGNYFVQALAQQNAALAGLIDKPAAPGPYPDNAVAVPQTAGTNRFLLYFHKLQKTTDLVSDVKNPLYRTYLDSQAYQAYKDDGDLLAKQKALFGTLEAKAAGRAILERLFTKAFVDKIDAGSHSFANTGTFSYVSDDGKLTSTLTGDGKTKIASLADAGSLMYELYVIAPAMRAEAGVDFIPYLPAAQARYFAALNDASDFYDKGPSITEKGDVTHKMAQILVDDVFKEVDDVVSNRSSNAAKIRFAHAEIIIPLATRIGLKNAVQQVPLAQTFSYASNPWRGEAISPMAANMQWDVYKNAEGRVLVKMLYNEKETDFKAACDSAKISPTSKFYNFAALKTCYGY
ncbi:histidine-type phosphatase [Deefgea piscis]|uniref:histidine-type phosphatase n=1 Tax=Deefgea piscis TaxID=2739061 RepID=UPI001C7EE4E6|nr:histidine-type phosphatase [Deefgea piscis]QZA81248.1 histidine-type phosphatase [Deefgea piscis]